MKASRALAVVVVLVLAALGACGDGGNGGGDKSAKAAKPPKTTTKAGTAPRTERVQATLEVTATGGATLAFDAPVELTVTTFEPSDPAYSLLSVGITEFARASDGRRFRTAVDLAGVYRGPGTYEFGTGLSGSAGLSNTFLHLVELRDPEGPFEEANAAMSLRFAQALAPCTMVVEKGRLAGSVHCPRLSDPSGAEIDYRLSWAA